MKCKMPRYTKPRKTWHYLNEFKVKAVQLSLLDNVQVKEVAETLDIHPFMLSRWRKEYREGKLVADKRQTIKPMSKDKKELDRVKRLEQEKDIWGQSKNITCGFSIFDGGTC